MKFQFFFNSSLSILINIFLISIILIQTESSLSVKKNDKIYKVDFMDESENEIEEPSSSLINNSSKLNEDTTRYDSFLINLPNSNPNFTKIKNSYRSGVYAEATFHAFRAAKNKKKKHQSDLFNFKKNFNNKTDNSTGENYPKKLICYYSIPSPNDKPFPVFPESIDPFLCTHIIVAFARVFNSTLVYSDPRDAEFYARTVKLKNQNKDLIVMISVGASNKKGDEYGEEFAKMISSKENRIKFIDQSVNFLKENKMDGFDLDFEFPSWGSDSKQKDEYSQLFKDYRSFMNEKNESFLLSAAVGALKPIIDTAYNITELAEHLDFVNLMAYDYHHFTTLTPFTGPNSPLFSSSKEIGFFRSLNGAWSANYYYQSGLPAEKIILGTATYGHTFELVDEKSTNYYSLAEGFGLGDGGFISYPDICNFLSQNGTKMIFDNDTKVPYAFNHKNWISFENEKSGIEKAKWIKEVRFGGIMVWNINADDAYKVCPTSKSKFPLINSIKSELFKK